MITDEPAIFKELIEPTNILELVRLGHLALLGPDGHATHPREIGGTH